MKDTWLNKWNERYSKSAYAYGTEPNEYLKEQLEKLEVGKILFGAEGEGRNAVYLAGLGYEEDELVAIRGRVVPDIFVQHEVDARSARVSRGFEI